MKAREAVSLSVGMPVYNGEPYLARAIESLLEQTYRDFELIISDNASTDSTREICEHYAEADLRVRYLRKSRNEGAVANYRTTLRLARGSLFKWAAHDDVCRATLLEQCVEALDRERDAVLAYSPSALIDARGWVKGVEPSRPQLDSRYPATRLREVADLNTQVTPLFGVIRREALEAVRPHGSFPGADRILLVELALRGRFVETQQILFEFRTHEGQYSRSGATSQFKRSWWSGANDDPRPLPTNWIRLVELYRAVTQAPLTAEQRRDCYGELPRWARRYWKRLVLDLWLIGRDAVQGIRGR